MFESCLRWFLINFDTSMFILALIFIVLHSQVLKTLPESEVVFRWISLFVLGFTCLYAFTVHTFFPSFTVAVLDWPKSPFQFEVGIANLAFGVLGVLAFKASYGFRLATVIGSTCWFWGDALGHIYHMVKYHTFVLATTSSWFWLDLFVPLILIICLVKLRPGKRIFA